MQYEIHPYAGLVPMATPDEQTALNLDILKNGLREPIVLWKGKIVDGRCRQIACNYAGEKIRTKDLDDELSHKAVMAFVKSVNTRRNLTITQKVMSACFEKRDTGSKTNDLATSWGVGIGTMNNGIYILKVSENFALALFNGDSVEIKDRTDQLVMSNKVGAVYAYLKREEQQVKENKDHEEHYWKDGSFIKTQAGKEWHQNFKCRNPEIKEMKEVVMALAELANYKFQEKETADIRYNIETGEVQ